MGDGEMRSARTVAACIGLATALAACNPVLDRQYFREGVGSNLYRDDLPEVTRLQEVYIAYICQQAGLAGPGETCANMGFGQPAWSTFVQAGMNDIDLRCDAYLAWLDDKKRSTTPILKELAALSAATAGILQATNAGPKSLAIVGIAFGLAAETFTNVNSRLLQEVNHSTVQTTVLGNQQRFRENVLRAAVTNRPDAIYLLRSYLRICLPFSIEMDINDTVTVFHRVGAGGLDAREPLLTRPSIIGDVSKPLPSAPRGVLTRGPTRFGRYEESLTPKDIREFQAALCIKPASGELGPRNSSTRLVIRDFLIGKGRKTAGPDADILTVRDNSPLRDLVESGASQRCPS